MDESKEEQWIKVLNKRQHDEADLHWKRNGFFLLSSSILLVALGQLNNHNMSISFAILGLTLNSIWLLIQYRSSQYIKWYKDKVKELEKTLNVKPDIYPKDLGGVEMRHLAMLLPLPFLFIWSAVLLLAIIDFVKNLNL